MNNILRTIVKLLIVFIIIIPNVNCILDVAYRESEKPVSIESNIIELNQPISGTVGFCSIFDYRIGGDVPFYHGFKRMEMGYEYLNRFQGDFLAAIKDKVTVVCSFAKIKDFNYLKGYPVFFTRYDFNTAKGHILIFDDNKKNSSMRMYPYAVDTLNKYFNCDYYLAGKVYLSFIDKNQFQINLYLTLYSNIGYKVWGKLYQKQFKVIKQKQPEEAYYLYAKETLTEYKTKILNDLNFINIEE